MHVGYVFYIVIVDVSVNVSLLGADVLVDVILDISVIHVNIPTDYLGDINSNVKRDIGVDDGKHHRQKVDTIVID